ncbi:MAG: hypothetical protein R2991_03580 [Thermoanaerobaculia bacterium]
MPEPRSRGRLADRLVVAWFVFAFLALIWPVCLPAARVRPLVLGVPFSLFWIAALLAASFVVLLVYELRRGGDDDA